jgi:hypothetical protein
MYFDKNIPQEGTESRKIESLSAFLNLKRLRLLFKREDTLFKDNPLFSELWDRVLRNTSPSASIDLALAGARKLANKLESDDPDAHLVASLNGLKKEELDGTLVGFLINVVIAVARRLQSLLRVLSRLPVTLVSLVGVSLAKYIYDQQMKLDDIFHFNPKKLIEKIQPYLSTYDPFLQGDEDMLQNFPKVELKVQKMAYNHGQTLLVQKMMLNNLTLEEMQELEILPFIPGLLFTSWKDDWQLGNQKPPNSC